jgi:NADH:ubiquinone oxidoreductase subunit 6 (subunit J)
MLEIQVESPEVLKILGYIVAIVVVFFTIAIMVEGKSTKLKKQHNIFDETDIY